MDTDNQHIQRSVGAMKKSGKLWIALGGVVIGVLLLLFGKDMGDIWSKDTTQEPTYDTGAPDRMSMEAYRTALEERVCWICTKVEGAGQVYAVVNLQSGYSYVYASDTKTTSGGVSEQYIIIGSGNDERVVYLTEQVPEILGIGVVCTGGGNVKVQKEVTALVSAAFGVGSHKIYVTGGG